MARGRRDRHEEHEAGLTRRCIATGRTGPREELIRFVAGPDGVLVPDLAARLPGRGAWVTSERAALAKAVDKSLFSRALEAKVTIPEGLVDTTENLLIKRSVDALALARKAGRAVCGFERCREALQGGDVTVLISAIDAAEGGKGKLRGIDDGAMQVSALSSEELGLAFGRDAVIHAALMSGGVSVRALVDLKRVDVFRA